MELLGFYDQPYQVAVSRPPTPPRVAAFVTSIHRSSRSLNSRDRVTDLWETTEVNESAMEWWKPQVVARRKLGGRRVRTSSLLVALVVAIGLISVTWSLVQRPGRAAEESLHTIGSDTRALLQTLPAVEEVVAGIGQPDAPDLTLSTERILGAESAARRVFADAGSQTGPRRDAAVSAAGGVLQATSRVNQLLAYRLSAERLLVPPALPPNPGATDLPSATEAVAGWRAEIETGVAELAPEVLPDHRSGLQEWLDSLDGWQSAYLDAIRQEDGQATAASLADLESQILGLRQTLLDELAEEGGDLRVEIADARQEAERLLGD